MDDQAVHSDRQLIIARTRRPPGLRFVGEIDATNVGPVARSLGDELARVAELHLDLTSLRFCDVSGIRALVAAAAGLDAQRRMVIHGLPAHLEKVMRVVGWGELPGLVLG